MLLSLGFASCNDNNDSDAYNLSQTKWSGVLLDSYTSSNGQNGLWRYEITVTFENRKVGEHFIKGVTSKAYDFDYAINDNKIVEITGDGANKLNGKWWIRSISESEMRLERDITNEAQTDYLNLERRSI